VDAVTECAGSALRDRHETRPGSRRSLEVIFKTEQLLTTLSKASLAGYLLRHGVGAAVVMEAMSPSSNSASPREPAIS